MNTIETNREGAGNTITAPISQPNQLIKWFFTFNNYENRDIEILLNTFKNICKMYCFQEEIGENGTPHLQGCIYLKEKMRWSEFKLDRKIHWEPVNDWNKSWKYCSKEETRNGNLYMFPTPEPSVKIKTIENLKPWQKSVEEFLKKEPDGRTINWYHDIIGNNGKSSLCKYLMVNYPKEVIVIQGGKLADVMNIIFNTNMDKVKLCIIDVPRVNTNKVSFAAIECILNGMITNTKYETGTKMFNPPHLVIFSNYEPENKEVMSSDRWNIVNICPGAWDALMEQSRARFFV